MSAPTALRVGVLGYGSIGRVVADALRDGAVPNCELAGVLRRRRTGRGGVGSLGELVGRSDLVVEAAGQDALRECGPEVLGAGVDLLVVSVGALADDALLENLRAARAGRLLLSTGAIGGLDVLQAAMRCGSLEKVALESRKAPEALLRPWMDEATKAAIVGCADEVEVFTGSAREAVRAFPQTANVAATLALATVGLDATRVRLLAASGGRSSHTIRAEGPSGRYEFVIENVTAPGNPKTSWITPFSVLRALENLSARSLVV